MTDLYIEIPVNSLGVNDDSAIVVDIIVEDGAFVSMGDEILTVETTKSSFDVEALSDGYVVHLHKVDDIVKVGKIVSLIVKEERHIKEVKAQYTSIMVEKSKGLDIQLTKKAKLKVEKYNISEDVLAREFSGIIREKDIDSLVSSEGCVDNRVISSKTGHAAVKNVMIYGAVDSGASLVDIEIIHSNKEYRVVCFFFDNTYKHGSIFGIPVMSWDEFSSTKENLNVDFFFVSIGNGVVRKNKVTQAVNIGMTPINVIHPSAEISSYAILGKNLLIKRGAIIGPNVIVKDGAFIDNGSIVSHDSIIGEYSHIAPGVSLGGNVVVGDYSIVGVGASISSDISIGKGSIVTTGSSVVTNHKNHNILQGNPAASIGKSNIKIE